MNNARRQEIAGAIFSLSNAVDVIEGLRDEEQDYYDNMPESFQMGERGETAQQAINCFEYALNSIEDAITNLEEAAGV